MNVEAWVEEYGRAWREKDADAVVGLFTEDAEYRSGPFREPSVGSAGTREYWTRATSTQEDADVRMGTPIVAGDRVAVEWWATMRDDGQEITLPGCLLLRFRAGRPLRGAPRVLARRAGPPRPPPRLGRVAVRMGHGRGQTPPRPEQTTARWAGARGPHVVWRAAAMSRRDVAGSDPDVAARDTAGHGQARRGGVRPRHGR